MRTIHVFPPSIFASVTAAAFERWFPATVAAEHEFWVVVRAGAKAGLPVGAQPEPRLRTLSDTEAFLHLLALRPGTKLVVHGLFGAYLYLALCARPDLMRDALWMIWGADIEPSQSQGPKSWLISRLHAHAARSFRHVLSVMKADHAKAVARFAGTSRWSGVFYPGIVDEQLLGAAFDHAQPVRELRRVVVGNSASESNRHLPLLERLAAAAPSGSRFYLPLSYGDARYRDAVIEAWRARFGAAVSPMVDFMSLPDYARFLASVDCGVYYYERQQGLGNILMLLALARPVYVPEHSQIQRYLSELGFAVRGISQLARELGGPVAPDVRQACAENRTLCLQLFSDRACRQAWSQALGIEAAGT